MDQGLASELDDLFEAKPAGALAYFSWAVQLVGTVWLIVQVCILWSHHAQQNLSQLYGQMTDGTADGTGDGTWYGTFGTSGYDGTSPLQPYLIQDLVQVLDAVTINRGTWSIAVLGSFIPGCSILGLRITTGIAVALELLFLGYAASLAHDSYLVGQAIGNPFYQIFPLVIVVLEASVLIFGKTHIKPVQSPPLLRCRPSRCCGCVHADQISTSCH
jgi:hypothetical protein